MTKQLKEKLQSVLWSYDIKSLNLKRSSELVIQQVLNRGDWELVRWLFRKYPESEIRKVVAIPRRGMWFAQPLNLWLKIYHIRLPKITRERALFRMDYRPDLFPASYFKKRRKH